MNTMQTLPKLRKLPSTMPDDGAVNITLEEGVPIFRASTQVQQRIQELLEKQRSEGLSEREEDELERYAEIDDYLSHLNRLVRNLVLVQQSS